MEVVQVDARAALRIATTAQGRALVIDFFAARCCTNVLVGDLETRWLDGTPPDGLVAVGSTNGTQILAAEVLVGVLARGCARVVETGGLFGRSLAVRLEAPEHWLAFLDTPAARASGGRGWSRDSLAVLRS